MCSNYFANFKPCTHGDECCQCPGPSTRTTKMHHCENCNKQFTTRQSRLRHEKLYCQVVKKQENGGPAAKKQKICHSTASNNYMCVTCNQEIAPKLITAHERSRQHRNNCQSTPLEDGVFALSSAFKSRIASYRICDEGHYIDLNEFMDKIHNKLLRLIVSQIEKFSTIKINLELFGLYTIESKNIFDVKSFNTTNRIVTLGTNIRNMLHDFQEVISQKMMDFLERDSGWTLVKILHLELNVNYYNPLKASSYIPLPPSVKMKRAIVNVQNQDIHCFGWSVVAAVCLPMGPEHLPSSYPHWSTLFNFQGIEFPVKLDSIAKFESQNNVSINVYGLELLYVNNKVKFEIVGPLYFTNFKKPVHINLLLLSDNDGNQHYCTITNLPRLVSSQLSKHHHSKFFCDGCLQYFTTQALLDRHSSTDCGKLYARIPNNELITNRFGYNVPANVLEFQNYHHKMTIPFIVYADFECLLKPMSTVAPNPNQSFSIKTFLHQPYSCAYYIKCSYNDQLSKFQSFRGQSSVVDFITALEIDLIEIYKKYLSIVQPMLPLTIQEEFDYLTATECHICQKPFQQNDIKVKDHCHLTGRYRSAAHSNCNLNFQIPNFIPIVFHNLTNYDSHLFIKELALEESEINILGKTKEKYITFSKKICVGEYLNSNNRIVKEHLHLRFIDSFQFLTCSLEKLAAALDDAQCMEVKRYFPVDREFQLIRQKGVFPYSFIDDFSKLDLTELPQKIDFYDKLRDEHISEDDYQRANTVWNTFHCQTLGEYSDLYLKSDILLLADVFENFRNMCLKHYELDPAHYVTAPSLSWNAMLKFTHVKLELLTDIDMLHFFKKGIRGGVSTCVKRAAQANNKFLPNYDPSKPTSYILYLDATNLYGWAMSEVLPLGGFTWLTQDEINSLSIMDLTDTTPEGYVLEVDISYPHHLHNSHNDMPFLPENLIPPNGKCAKLIPNLCAKTNYIIHYRNLKQALQNGLELTKIHRVLKFNQSSWLKPYIDLNTKLRNQTKNKFEKDLFKLMNNSVYGKTMENVDNRVDIKLATHWKKNGHKYGAETWIAKPQFKNCSIFTENLVAIEMNKVQVTYDKPIYVGFSILEISKTLMYDFFYNFLKVKYGNNVQLLYTDTDSLILEIYTENVYNDIKQNIDRFDTSNYPENNIHDIPKTVSVIGKMKDEYAGVPIVLLYGTGAKAYCVQTVNDLIKKAKGVSKHVIDKSLTLLQYRAIATNPSSSSVFCVMNVFKSYLHNMYTELRNKIALSNFDDKRYILGNSIDTLAWGHYDIDRDRNLDSLIRELQKYVEPTD
ncbi:uncharacterized protein LOC135266857 isoform X1 [Tribolium castaneum]|uniref:uncharacterized protein LOC135266857 isoform X1 n=1 Tax=Tribolium castaneum TaxID=7070 RepID=UPI0030FE6CE7